MNVSASKILLGLSVAAYTYCTWDHLFAKQKADEAAATKGPTLTAALVNRVEVLSLGRDAFESVALDRTGDPNYIPPSVNGHAAIASKMLGPMALQGVFMTPAGHAALINGKPVIEGEEVSLEDGGPKITARKIGDDYAIIVSGTQQVVLKLEDGNNVATDAAPAATAGSAPAAPAPAAPARPNTNSGGAPAAPGHGPGWSDPYAGHKTHH